MLNFIKVERTGETFSITSCQFLVTFPDGSQDYIWSPPWHSMTLDEEEKEAMLFAEELWKAKQKL